MIYGYDTKVVNEYGLRQMREISISLSPKGLRALADFLLEAANELESAKSRLEAANEPESAESRNWHRHSPSSVHQEVGCDIVIVREPAQG